MRPAFAAACGFLLVLVAGVLLAVGHSEPAPGPARAADTGTFGTHYAGLQQRLRAARLPTLATARDRHHTHQSLVVLIDGRRLQVPENLGIDPRAPGEDAASVHTHVPGAIIHDQGAPAATLGDLFTVWGVSFSGRQLGPKVVADGATLRMWVNGRPSRAFGRLRLRDGQVVVLSYRSAVGTPPIPRSGRPARLT